MNTNVDDNNKKCDLKTVTNKEESNDKTYIEERWIRGPYMCEICGLQKATVNLDLKYGSHKECRYCWDH